MQMDQQVFEG